MQVFAQQKKKKRGKRVVVWLQLKAFENKFVDLSQGYGAKIRMSMSENRTISDYNLFIGCCQKCVQS